VEKISGILPATARVTTVDLRNSGSSRSGMPSWGREVGVTAAAAKQMEAAKQIEVAEQAQFSTSARAMGSFNQQMEGRVKSAPDPKSEIVKKLADGFFMNKTAQAPQMEGSMQSLPVVHDSNSDMKIEMPKIELAKPEDFLVEDDEMISGASREPLQGSDQTIPDDEVLATGHYLDVRA
jgi:hypothetical protein